MSKNILLCLNIFFSIVNNIFPPGKQADIGCLSEDDPTGVRSVGPATRDRDGDTCATWSEASGGDYSFRDNLCRNPDNDHSSPFCYLASGEPSSCDIPRCKDR